MEPDYKHRWCNSAARSTNHLAFQVSYEARNNLSSKCCTKQTIDQAQKNSNHNYDEHEIDLLDSRCINCSNDGSCWSHFQILRARRKSLRGQDSTLHSNESTRNHNWDVPSQNESRRALKHFLHHRWGQVRRVDDSSAVDDVCLRGPLQVKAVGNLYDWSTFALGYLYQGQNWLSITTHTFPPCKLCSISQNLQQQALNRIWKQ